MELALRLFKQWSPIVGAGVLLLSLATSYSSMRDQVAHNTADIVAAQQKIDKLATKDQVDDLKQDLRDVKNYLLRNKH